MIINQRSNSHWQLVIVSSQATDTVLKNGVLLLFLHKYFPDIQPSQWFRLDFDSLIKQDIFGTCLMQKSEKLVSFLKFCCHASLTGDSPKGWDRVLDSLNETTSVVIFAYAKSIMLTNQNRTIINVHLSKQRTQDYDAEVFIAKTKETVYTSIKL